MTLLLTCLALVFVAFMIVCIVRFPKLRDNWSGIIGIPGAYLTATAIVAVVWLLIGCVGILFGNKVDPVSIVTLIIMALLCAIPLFNGLKKCETTKEKVMMPFVCIMLAFGFVWRVLMFIFMRVPIDSGSKVEDKSYGYFPEVVYDDNGVAFSKMSEASGTAFYRNNDGIQVELKLTDLNGDRIIHNW